MDELRDKTREFFELLYGDASSGYLIIWAKGYEAKAYPVTQINQAVDTVEKLAQITDTYYGVGLHKKIPEQGKRGSASDVVAIPGFWLDIDYGPNHKKRDLPKTLEDAQELLHSFPLPPSLQIHSGQGLHCYWLFREPWVFESDAERETATNMSKAFARIFTTAAKGRGWNIDNVADLARVLRPAGTFNHKPKDRGQEALQVKMIECNDNRYNIDDVDQYLPTLEVDKLNRKAVATEIISPAMSDSEVIRRASTARNGDKFKRLHIGNIDGYPSASEADQAYVNILVFWTQDQEQLSRLWRNSGLKDVERTDPDKLSRDDYVYRTINKALSDCEEHFKGAKPAKEKPGQEIVSGFLEQATAGSVKHSGLYAGEVIGALATLSEPEIIEVKSKCKELFGKEFSVRDFDRALKVTKREHLRLAQPGEYNESKPVELPNLELPFDVVCPDGWQVNESGVYREKFKDGEVYWDQVAHAPIIITGRKTDINNSTEHTQISWYRGGRWVEKAQDRMLISVARELASLSSYGAPVTSNNAGAMVDYLTSFEQANLKELPCSLITTRLGWQKGTESFLVGERVYGSDDSLEFYGLGPGDEQFAEGFMSEGDLDTWKGIIKELESFPIAASMVIASFASPLLRILDCPSFILDISYSTSRGKTTALRVAASVWGKPDERSTNSILGRWDSTRVGIKSRAALLYGLPLMLDDTAGAGKPEDIEQFVYDLAQGQDKARGAKQGGTQLVRSWETIGISTGENPILSFCKKDGAKGRVLSIQSKPFGADDPATGRLVNELSERAKACYGVAGPKFIEYIMENRDKWPEWKKLYREGTKIILNDEGGDNPIAGRVAGYFALLQLTGALVNEALDIRLPSINQLWPVIIGSLGEADKAKLAFEQVIGWADAHEQEFHGRAWGDDPKQPIQGWAGNWPRGDRTELGFFPDKLNKILKEYEHDPDSTIKHWLERGWVIKGDGNNIGKRTTLVGTSFGSKKRPRLITLDPCAVEELS